LEDEEINMIEAMKIAAIEYCKNYTGLKEFELCEHEDITIAVLCLISDMWDNRSMTVDRANKNMVVENILGMHCTNFMPVEG